MTAGLTSGVDEVDDVIADFIIDVDGVNDLAGRRDFVGANDGVDSGVGGGGGHGVEDPTFFFETRVVDFDFEHETVDLGFGEGVGAFLIDGVFSSEDEEGVR